MKKNQTIIIISIFTLVLLVGMIIAVFMLRKPQTTIDRASEAVCPANGATCEWDTDGTASTFKVVITNETTGETVVSISTANTSVQFTPNPNHQYKCDVTPINSCGEGPVASATNSCIPQATPTATPTPEPTSTPTPTVIMCQQPSTCMSADECTTQGGTTNGEKCEEEGKICCVPQDSTPTPTATPTETPVPTATPTETPTATPIPTFTPVPTHTPLPTNTPYPTNTLYPSATPTDIIIVVNNTNTPTPTSVVQGTTVPTIPNAGVPVSWALLLIPIALVGLGLIF